MLEPQIDRLIEISDTSRSLSSPWWQSRNLTYIIWIQEKNTTVVVAFTLSIDMIDR